MADALYPNTCVADVDCDPYTTNRICYQNATWLSANVSQCQCSVFYGWEGENCDQYGTGTILSTALYAIFGLASLVLLVAGASRLLGVCRNSPNSRFLELNAANTTLIFVMCGFAGSVLTAMFTILNFLVVEGTPAAVFVSNKDGFARFEYFTRNLAQPLLGLACTLSQLNVCLMWLDLAQASKQLRPHTRSNLDKSRRIVVVFEALLMLAVVVGLVLQGLTGFPVLTALVIPYTIVVIVLYVLGGRQMDSVMATMMHTAEGKYKKLQASIRWTTIAIIINDIVFIFASVGYAVMGFDRELMRNLSPAGSVVTIEKISHHMIFVGFSISNFILWRYLSQASKGGTSAGGATGSFEKGTTQEMRPGVGTHNFKSSFNGTDVDMNNSSSSMLQSPNPKFASNPLKLGFNDVDGVI
jgi:hypothetical protein